MLESALRKLIFGTTTVLGIGYVLVNIAMLIMLSYFLSQITISSTQIAVEIGGVTLFLLASIAMVMLGILTIVGGFRYYKGNNPKGIIFLGAILASFYLLCLGIGSTLLLPQISLHAVLLIIGPILVMAATPFLMLRPFLSKLIGSILGILGGTLLASVILNLQILTPIFVGWNIPFPGPFMSVTIVEATTLILGSIAVVVYSIIAEYKEGSVKYILFPITTLVYGIGVFIGPLILASSLWNLIWKAPRLPPLHDVPGWVVNATILWSAGLIILAVAGVLLTSSSYMGFYLAVSASEEK